MKLLILFAAVTFVAANSLVGSKSCTWGPSYWCSHISRAKQCGAVSHCMSTVWKHQLIQPKSTAECLYCQMGFNELKDVLADPAIEKDISKYVADVCKILPDPDWKLICNGIVTEDLPIVIQMLDNKLSSGMICATMGMCSGLEYTLQSTDVTTNNQVDEKLKNSFCADCTKFFQDVQQSITSPETESELAQLFNQVICDKIPSLTQVCKDAVNEVIPVALQFLADQLDPNVTCRVFGFCVSSRPTDTIPLKNVFKNLKQPLKYRSSEECEACKDIMGELVNELRDNNTQAFVVGFLKTNVCKNLGALATECNNIVDQYTSELFELLVNELDPTTVCEMVGLCAVPTGGLKVPVGIMEPARLISDGYKADSTPFCFICELVMQEVANILRNNVTIKSMEDMIDKICNKFPSEDLKNKCLKFANNLGPEVIDLLKKDFNPKTVCSELKLCAAKLSSTLKDMKNAECDLCIIGVHEVEVFVANRSMDSLMTGVRSLCVFLPGNYSTKCMTYVNQYLPIVINLLKSKEDPRALCQLGGLCTSTIAHKPYMTKPLLVDTAPVVVNAVSPVNVKASELCEVCNTAILILKEELGNNATEAEIKQAIEGLCKSLPASFVSECQSLVAQYGDRIIELLLSHSGQICKDIGLCTSKVDSMHGLLAGILSPLDTLPIVEKEGEKAPVVVNAVSPVNVKASELCEVCNTAILILKEELGNNATEAEIKQAIEGLCKSLPASFVSECQSLVAQYGDRIIELLLSHSGQICKDIGLCTSKVDSMHGLLAGILSPLDTLPIVEKEGEKAPVVVNAVSPVNVKASELCEVCNTAILILKEELGNNATEAEIKKAIEGLCESLPASFVSECQSLVAQYGDRIIELLLSHSDQICKDIGLCTSKVDSMHGLLAGILSPLDTLPIGEKEGEKAPVVVNAVSPVNVKASELCEVCNTAILILKEELGNNATEAEIKKAIEGLCESLPASFVSECQSLVAQYGDRIIELLLSHFGQICKDIGLCTSKVDSMHGLLAGILSPLDTLPIVAKEGEKEQGNDKNSGTLKSKTSCTVCNDAIIAIKFLLQDPAMEKALSSEMEKFCEVIPKADQEACRMLVQEYGIDLIDLLLQKIEPSVLCHEVALCSSTVTNVVAIQAGVISPVNTLPFASEGDVKESQPERGVSCEVCTNILTVADEALQQTSTQEAIREVMLSACKELGSGLDGVCEELVEKYLRAAINYIILSETPASLCSVMRFCPSTDIPRRPVNVDLSAALPEKFDLGNPVTCEVCQYAMSYLESILEGNRTEAAVKDALDRLCGYIPSLYTSECISLVNQYSDVIIRLIVTELASPQTICRELGLCAAVEKLPLKNKVSSHSVDASAECVICKLAMGELEKQLETNASKEEIKAALEKVCTLLPDTISAECQSFVDEYSDIIVNLLEKEASPEEICTLLKLCTADKLKGLSTMVKLLPAKEVPSQNVGASIECVICEYVMTALESALETNATQEEIKSALEKVCSLLPVTVSAECQDFVGKYAAIIINLLEKEASPAEICTLIKLCSADKMAGLLKTVINMLPTKGKVAADYCAPCKQVVDYIKMLLGENVTKEEIITYLKRTCDILPDTVTVQCEDAVEQYVPAIMDLIQQDLSPEQICMELKLCNATSLKTDDKLYFHPRARLLGGEKCTFGPSYWCANEENAKRCKAEEHCRRHVWNN